MERLSRKFERSLEVPGRPKILGYFSIDGNKNYLPDSSKLKYFNRPKEGQVDLDLTKGFKNTVIGESSGRRRPQILEWMELNREKIKASPETGRAIEPNFVCTPQSLVYFMTYPYIQITDWNMWAGKWKGTIYIRAAKGFTRRKYEDEDKFWFYGRKFDQYMVSETPEKAPDTTKPVVETEEFRCVYRHQFSNYSVLYSAASRAILSKELLEDSIPFDKLKSIDLRVSKSIESGGNENHLKRYRFLKWWANAFLINADEVLCGYWDNDGIVREIKTYKTVDLPETSEYLWHPQKCFKSCETILSKLVKSVVDDCDKTIYELTKKPWKPFTIKKLKPSEDICIPIPELYRNTTISNNNNDE